MPEKLWREVHDMVQEAGIKTIRKRNNCKKAKWLYEEALQIAVKRREVKGKGEKERYLLYASKQNCGKFLKIWEYQTTCPAS